MYAYRFGILLIGMSACGVNHVGEMRTGSGTGGASGTVAQPKPVSSDPNNAGPNSATLGDGVAPQTYLIGDVTLTLNHALWTPMPDGSMLLAMSNDAQLCDFLNHPGPPAAGLQYIRVAMETIKTEDADGSNLTLGPLQAGTYQRELGAPGNSWDPGNNPIAQWAADCNNVYYNSLQGGAITLMDKPDATSPGPVRGYFVLTATDPNGAEYNLQGTFTASYCQVQDINQPWCQN